MMFRSVLLCVVTCVLTTKGDILGGKYEGEMDHAFSSWPSIPNTARVILSKRQAPPQDQTVTASLHKDAHAEDKGSGVKDNEPAKQVSEGGTVVIKPSVIPPAPSTTHNETTNSSVTESVKGNPAQNEIHANTTVVSLTTMKPINSTSPKAPSHQADLSNPGVMKRGLIVFGGFSIMAIAYFVFYRKKSKNNDSNNTHGTNDTNQFRYGVLQSDDRRDNLELSHILTVESDEDEDEDLEIFDLEQKKKSLSYVNLQTNDDYVVHGSNENIRDRDNLLLDIEDASSDTLINWSSTGNKSIL